VSKTSPFYFQNKSVENKSILIIFGKVQSYEKTSHQNFVHLACKMYPLYLGEIQKVIFTESATFLNFLLLLLESVHQRQID